MTLDEIQAQIDKILNILATSTASEIVEYQVGNKMVKRRRSELREELSFWRQELLKASSPAKTILTRF